MPVIPDAHRAMRRLLPLIAALVGATLAIALAACGSSSPTAPAGLVIAGPGLQAGASPWKPEYAHLSRRIKEMGLPPTGNEKFHIHAALHIYKDGLLVAVPAEVGIDTAHGLETSLHTHDVTGVIHMEAPHPFKFTLGDFFKVWGVAFGPEQVGDLHGYGGDKLHFYVNGRKLANPAAYVLHRGDNIAIGYGPVNSFPHAPNKQILEEVEKGTGGFGCSTKPGAKAKSCVVRPAPTSTSTTSGTSSTTTTQK
jgi:hypothetical protein